MAQLFPPIMNVVSKATILGSVALVAMFAEVWGILIRSPYVTRAGVVLDQPVPFSHKHHVSELGIDCRFCHAQAAQTAFAGMPPTSTCMTCHSQIHTESAMLEPVRASSRSGVPLHWQRVNDLPDFVYFNHSIHVNKGIGCETCHGRVDQMPLTWRHASLYMDWCLDCHRQPQQFLRPRDRVFDFGWEPSEPQSQIGARLARENKVQAEDQKLTNCSICHR